MPNTEATKIAVLIEKMNGIIKDCGDFVTKIEFNSRIGPLEKVVYGMVSAILLAVLGWVLNLVKK